MSGFEKTLGIGIAGIGAGLGAFSSVSAARQQNELAKDQAKSVTLAANIKSQQLSNAAQLQRIKLSRERDRLVGSLRVAGAEAGVNVAGSSFGALQRQANFDAELSKSIIDQNLQNQTLALNSEVQSSIQRIGASTQNSLLQGFLGVIGGGQAGLQIASGLSQLKAGKQEKGQA